MDKSVLSDEDAASAVTPRWGAVFSLALGVIGFVAAEILPVSLLTPMASDLGISEGLAGQAVTTTAVIAIATSLLGAAAARQLDRRVVLLILTALLTVSNLLAAFTSNYATLLAARVLLGLGLGGFWSMSTAVQLRLVPGPLVPRALSIIYGSVSIAVVVAGSAGSYLGSHIGWRGVLLATAALNAAALVWQFFVLPKMPSTSRSRLSTVISLLKRPKIGLATIGVVLVFGGHYAFFTYLRPFLETVAGVDVNGISIIFLGFGIANVVGTLFSSVIIRRSLPLTLAVVPLLMAAMAFTLLAYGGSTVLAITLVVLWGGVVGTVPMSWNTWFTRNIPDEAESAGGLRVASIQLAITTGAAIGGILFDAGGPSAVFIGCGSILLLASFIVVTRLRVHQ